MILGAGNQTLANTNNNYSGGTIVGSGATLTLGTAGSAGIPGNVSAGTGSITLSNNTTLFMNGNGTTFAANPVTIVSGATASFNSQFLADQYSGLITGDSTATNIVAGQWTAVPHFECPVERLLRHRNCSLGRRPSRLRLARRRHKRHV